MASMARHGLLLVLFGCLGSAFCAEAAPGSDRELYIAVKQRHEDLLFSLLTSHSDPASPSYGRHLSLPEVCNLVSPHPEHVAAVEAWAVAHGATHVQHSACKEFITIRIAANRLRAAMSGTPSLECTAAGCSRPVAVPPSLEHAVDFIEGLGGLREREGSGAGSRGKGTHIPRGGAAAASGEGAGRSYNPEERRRQRANDRHLSPAGGGISKKGPWYPSCLATSAVPPCLKKLHNVTVERAGAPGKAPQGVALFGPQFYSPEDLSAFQASYNVTPNTVKDLNGNKPATPGTEASLDVQYITCIGGGVETWFMHWACTTNDCKPFLTWMLEIANLTHPPVVQSVSVGTTEYEYLTEMGEKHVVRMNAEFAKAGVRGISLLFASGDRASQVYEGKYWVNFPSGSPRVTAVGGVWLGELGGGPLTADPDTTGGFSNTPVHARMPYQDDAVTRYLAEASEEGAVQPKGFNASNRGVPDLASASDAYIIIKRGEETFVGGTSAACPVVAGMISLLNDARSAAGRPMMGFLNPFLYANQQCFRDIVGGKNAYGAVKGWDPASGLGVPVFDCLLKAAMAPVGGVVGGVVA